MIASVELVLNASVHSKTIPGGVWSVGPCCSMFLCWFLDPRLGGPSRQEPWWIRRLSVFLSRYWGYHLNNQLRIGYRLI
jgi:hypothetical protein